MCDVDVVGAPVGDLAAGVIQNPAEVPVAAFLSVRGPGGRAEPHLVVKALGHRHNRLRVNAIDGRPAAARVITAADTNFDSLQLTDALITNQLAPKAKVCR